MERILKTGDLVWGIEDLPQDCGGSAIEQMTALN